MASVENTQRPANKEKPGEAASNGRPAGLEEETGPCGGVISTVGVRIIQTIVFMYDFVTFPFYLAYQRPWQATQAAAAIRAVPIERTKNTVTFQPIEKTCPELELFKVGAQS